MVQPKILQKVEQRVELLAQDTELARQLVKKDVKIKDYCEFQEELYAELDQPNMALVFNSHRRVLQVPGLPPLMREIAEFFECG